MLCAQPFFPRGPGDEAGSQVMNQLGLVFHAPRGGLPGATAVSVPANAYNTISLLVTETTDVHGTTVSDRDR